MNTIVEHDRRLRTICTQTPWVNFDSIVDVDRVAAINDDIIASHPIAIYLNKLAPKSQKFRRINKDVIYKRHQPARVTPAHLPLDIDTESLEYRLNISESVINGLKACSFLTINPRNRWLKLYERNPRFTATMSTLLKQLHQAIQTQSRFTESSPSEKSIPRSIVIPIDKYQKCYKVRIYHRQAWNPMKEGASFPSIWKEPDPSASVDDVSGLALRHITLLCRDMICECNKCTKGCNFWGKVGCDTCKQDIHEYLMRHAHPSGIYYGSFAEGCMLPTFYVWNKMNETIKKSSDIDWMAGSLGLVGFNAENESNIFATIETENCKPGYLRLRFIGNREIIRTLENIEYANNKLARNSIRNLEQLERRCFKTSLTRGPARTNISYFDTPDTDRVQYFSCSSWPPIARTWIDRERRSKWPSNKIIREIVSKGCRIVHKSHPSSIDPDAEFRFSFSVAELILFNTLSMDQKKCFIAFKALIKHKIYRSEIITQSEIDLSTYHLKTIFLWTCETIPADQWQTTNGWARCLLYMIDQLYACLESRTLPGYFIEESNLMNSIELPETLLSEIRKLRRNPITSAATFLDSTRCFRHSHFKTSDHIQDLCGFDLIEKLILRRQLILLQKMTIEMDSTRGVTFWKKKPCSVYLPHGASKTVVRSISHHGSA